MSQINLMVQQAEAPRLDKEQLSQWIEQVARAHGRVVGRLTYVFCNDDYILNVNRTYLQHDYYTDIITFDYSNSRRISGDMVISLDTVLSNSQLLGRDYNEELLRVVIHGVLHLCGINDKAPGEREIMELHENEALSTCPKTIFLP